MSNRKPFNDKAGYIASRHNEINNGWVVIYLAKKQGIDESGGKYAVVCELHNTIVNTTSLPKARPLLKYPDFCTECKKTNTKNTCESCGKETEEAYELEDEYVCGSCYQDAVSRAEYAYESAKEEGLI